MVQNSVWIRGCGNKIPGAFMSGLVLFAQSTQISPVALFGNLFLLLVELILIIVMLVGVWRVFEKAGEPGWAAIIPIYNLVVLLKITGYPIWFIIFGIIPCVNLIGGPVLHILTSIELARRFKQGSG